MESLPGIPCDKRSKAAERREGDTEQGGRKRETEGEGEKEGERQT